MSKKSQQGSAAVVVLVIVVIGLVGALGWVFWKNSSSEKVATDTSSAKTDQAGEQPAKTEKGSSSAAKVSKYQDFRKNDQAGTGISLKTTSDVSKLTDAGAELKSFFEKSDIGQPYSDDFYGSGTRSYTIERLYGNYAIGVPIPGAAHTIWGPKDGRGEVTDVAGTQQDGFYCDELKAASVPSQLVDGQCYTFGGSATDPVTYQN